MDTYHELHDTESIRKFLGGFFGVALSPARDAGASAFAAELRGPPLLLESFCRIVTTRRKYLVDETFTVDLDEADFGHVVGEIELVVDAAEDVPTARQRIADMCAQHPWFFDTRGKTMGKLFTYIQARNADQWRQLVSCGLVQRKIGGAPPQQQPQQAA